MVMKLTFRHAIASVCYIAVLLSMAGQANAANLALSKSYSWSRVPGQGSFYRDDWTGPHAVHTDGPGVSDGPGVFDTGDLTDGVRQGNIPSIFASPSPVVTQWGSFNNSLLAEVIIDLGHQSRIDDLVVGTHVSAGNNNNAPSNVDISFSLDNNTFFGVESFDLEAMFGPLPDGSHDLLVTPSNSQIARYVSLTFGPGSMTEPSGQDPDEKWMLDEIMVNGEIIVNSEKVPEPVSVLGLLGIAAVLKAGLKKKQTA